MMPYLLVYSPKSIAVDVGVIRGVINQGNLKRTKKKLKRKNKLKGERL